MNGLLFDSVFYLVAACHILSVAYLLYANYVRVRYREFRKPATRASTLVAVPWLLYAVFFVPLRVTCHSTSVLFIEAVACVLEYIWLFYVALAVFIVCFAWATGICWHLAREIHQRALIRPAH